MNRLTPHALIFSRFCGVWCVYTGPSSMIQKHYTPPVHVVGCWVCV